MGWETLAQMAVERPTLHLRLAAGALAGTLLLLEPSTASPALALILVAYVALAIALRFAVPTWRIRGLPIAGIVMDVAFVTALVVLMPPSIPIWTLYVLPIGSAALRFGPIGAIAATAAALVGYDISLAVWVSVARALDLWALQAILATGLVVLEIAWLQRHNIADREHVRSYAIALRSLAATREEAAFREELVAQAVGGMGAAAAWVWAEDGRAMLRTVAARGPAVPADPLPLDTVDVTAEAQTLHTLPGVTLEAPIVVARISERPYGALAVRFERQPLELERPLAFLRDLANDAAPLLAALRTAAEARVRIEALESTGLRAIRIQREPTAAGVLAEAALAAAELAGSAAVVRPADGTILAGDLPAPAAVALARELVPPALIAGPGHEVIADAEVDSALAVRVGPGLALVAAGTRRRLDEADLGLIRALGDISHARITAIGERDRAKTEMDRLSALIEDLRRDVRVRDDAVAAAVHELRNPLTSVHGYAQLMARNLDAVQRQVVQLERLIADLLRAPGEVEPGFAPVDLATEAHEAARRAELGGSTQVSVEQRGDCPPVHADAVRITQLLDNLIGNAVKFSPPGSHVDVILERIGTAIRVSVADRGIGIAPGELQRIFERYHRGEHAADVPGLGIGLTLCRDIAEAHGGRIWAESEGMGKGSTFHVELPIVAAVTAGEVQAGS